MMKLEQNSIKKRTQKTRVNSSQPIKYFRWSRGWNNIIESKQNKSWSLILNQLNIKKWDLKKS